MIIAIGDNPLRRSVFERFQGAAWISVIHPEAFVHPSVRIGDGTVVFAGAVIQTDAEIGNHAIVNTGATIDHDCVLDDFVHVAPGVHLAGCVKVGEGGFLGIGAAAIMSITIGEWTTVGAGSVVVRDLPANIVAVGNPARQVKSKEQP